MYVGLLHCHHHASTLEVRWQGGDIETQRGKKNKKNRARKRKKNKITVRSASVAMASLK